MKTTPSHIARALIETAQEVSPADIPSLVDTALHLLHEAGLAREIRSFPRTVRDEFQKSFGIVGALLVIPSDEAHGSLRQLPETIEAVLQKKVDLDIVTDPSLLGGALLSIGDERFDASLRGALERLRAHLSAHSLAS